MEHQFQKCIDYFARIILSELNSKNCNCWVAGGCVRDFFTTGYIGSDVDIFFPNQAEFDKASNCFITTEINGTPIARVLTENNRVLKIQQGKFKFDLVKKFFASPTETIENFDFTVCCGACSLADVFLNERFFQDNARKALVIHSLPFPFSTLARLQKYAMKGYHMCPENMQKLIIGINKAVIPEGQEDTVVAQFDPMSGNSLFAGWD